MLRQASRYLKYYLTAGNAHGLHSPFVYDLYTRVITNPHPYYVFEDIEELRLDLLDSEGMIDVTDFGAGSRVFKSNRRSVAKIARHVVKSAKYGTLLFRLVNHFKPRQILELGTSLGITTLYLAMADRNSEVHTLEGCPETLAVAKAQFETMDAKHIRTYEGPFEKQLPLALSNLEALDFAFIDGHHTKAATLDYFEQCLPKVHAGTVMVMDDIHWSDEMEEAWKTLKAHPRVTISIDLFQVGLIFFREEHEEKEHFTLRY